MSSVVYQQFIEFVGRLDWANFLKYIKNTTLDVLILSVDDEASKLYSDEINMKAVEEVV